MAFCICKIAAVINWGEPEQAPHGAANAFTSCLFIQKKQKNFSGQYEGFREACHIPPLRKY